MPGCWRAPRHVIDTQFNLVYCGKWHPMTWRAISARPWSPERQRAASALPSTRATAAPAAASPAMLAHAHAQKLHQQRFQHQSVAQQPRLSESIAQRPATALPSPPQAGWQIPLTTSPNAYVIPPWLR